MDTFASYHPAALLGYFMAVLLPAMFSANPALHLLALLGGLAFWALLVPGRTFAGDLAFYTLLSLMIAVTNPLFSHNGVTPLFFLNGNPVTLEAVWYGVDMAVMLVAVLYWCKCFHRVMSDDKLLFLLAGTASSLSLLISSAIRFVPELKERIARVHQAQKAMGLYSSGSYVDRLLGGLRVFSAVLSWSLECAVETGQAMKGRGYGLKGRSHYALFRLRPRDGWFGAVTLCMAAAVVTVMARGALTHDFYPKMTGLSAAPEALLGYAAYGVLAALPFLLEAAGRCRWHLLLRRCARQDTGVEPGKDGVRWTY